MPNLTFVLPHWLYWLVLATLPLLMMWKARKPAVPQTRADASSLVAYFLLLTGGFVGCHRFYLKSLVGLLYVPLFIAILVCNIEGREARNELSLASNEVASGEFRVERFGAQLSKGVAGAAERLSGAQEKLTQAQQAQRAAVAEQQQWDGYAQLLAGGIVLFMLFDAWLIPGLCRRYRQRHAVAVTAAATVDEPPVSHPNPLDKPPVETAFTRLVERGNELCGQFVAYWSLIAVFFYYYEVIARYLFNSPTNWAHESMFLMFGMQYLIAGGYVMRNNGHVRVDVFYTNFTPRVKAAVDLATSVFFFIFATTLLWTGWTFFSDSFAVREVSFTEWGIQYWPVKFALPLGAALILLQGVAWLVKDLLIVMGKTEEPHHGA